MAKQLQPYPGLPEDGPGSPNYLGGQAAPILPMKPVTPQPMGPGKPMINPGIPGAMPKPPVSTLPGGVQPMNPNILPPAPGGQPSQPNIGPGMPGTGGPGIQRPPMPPVSPTPVRDTTAVTTFGPGNDLRDNQIAPGQEVDRYQMGLDRFSQYAEATDPHYQKTIRDATKAAAANGRLGSGMLTTDYGNLAGDRSRELDLERRGFLTDALEGTIDDGRSNRGELRTERDFQTGSAQQATENQIRQRLLEEALLNGQTNRDSRITDTLGQWGGF